MAKILQTYLLNDLTRNLMIAINVSKISAPAITKNVMYPSGENKNKKRELNSRNLPSKEGRFCSLESVLRLFELITSGSITWDEDEELEGFNCFVVFL